MNRMKVLSFSSLIVYTAALLSASRCEVLTHTLESGPEDDHLHIDSAPDTAALNSTVQLRYTCTKSCRIGIEIVLSTRKAVNLVTFRRTWTHSKRFGMSKTRRVRLRFPPAVVYKRDFFMRRPAEVRDIMLRAWLIHLKGDNGTSSSFDRSLVKYVKPLQMVPPSERPTQSPSKSVAWGAELMWNLTRDRIQQCSLESDVVDFLTFPFACTNEKYGVVRKFSSFANKDLETARLRITNEPRVTLSVWLYLLNFCSSKLCGIIKHVNEHKSYDTPLIMLNNKGEIVIQVALGSWMEIAFTVHVTVPLRSWFRLDLSLYTTKAKIQITQATPKGKLVEATHRFQNPVLYNDTSGYFVIGGDIYMEGIHGYFGPTRVYRLGTEKVVNPLSSLAMLNKLDEVHKQCEEIQQITESFALEVNNSRFNDDVCESSYRMFKQRFGNKRCRQSWSWDQHVKYSTSLDFLRMHEKQMMSGSRSRNRVLKICQRHFQIVMKELADSMDQKEVDSSLMDHLKFCACWGHQQATLMLATLHLSGLVVPVDREMGHVYSLMGGVADDRLALLHLGYKHMQGLDGFPKDQDMAYGYYSNVGQQTSIDSDKFEDSNQSLNEHVDLTSADDMLLQTGELGDVVQFVKHQAERGDIESQKLLARMLFWGSNGVERDIETAIKWYAKCALSMTDASSMYDYGIFLLKGIGVKKNITLGVKLLEKAADMGSVEALNGLGWHYNTVGNNRKAMHYFERAAQNGSRDAVFNLGVYYLSGSFLDFPIKNETGAFQFFLKAGEMGHIEGGLEAASYLSKGNLRQVHRDPERAVSLLKPISEKNGHLGYYNKDALKAYQNGLWSEALLKYSMVAETGLAVAQSNAAHLCEVLQHGSECQWRYNNLSTHNHAPNESGLLKMGDYYSALGESEKALSLYTRAALHGSPQATYNMVVLIEGGVIIPSSVLEKMGISAEDQLDKRTVMEKLLLRCRSLEGDADELSPCSLALLQQQVVRAWHSFTGCTIQLTVSLSMLLIVLSILIKSGLTHRYAMRSGVVPPASQGRPGASSPVAVTWTRSEEAADSIIVATGVWMCSLCIIFITHMF